MSSGSVRDEEEEEEEEEERLIKKALDSKKNTTPYWRPVILITMMFIIHGTGYFISAASQTQLLEDIICRNHYRGQRPQPELQSAISSKESCKAAAVQEILAELLGMQTFFDGIPGLLLAIPYGALADKYGRKPILIMSMFGQVLGFAWVIFICWAELPLKIIWLSSAFTVVGGGSTVAASIVMMVIADVIPESERSKLFFYLQGGFICSELVGPPLGSVLMGKSPWIAILLGFGFIVVASSLALFVPETFEGRKISETATSPSMDTYQSLPPDEESLDDELLGPKQLRSTATSWFRHCLQTFMFVLSHGSVVSLVATFFIADFSRQSLSLLVQYVSERYSWSLARASWLTSFRAGFQLLFYLAVFPATDAWLIQKMGWQAKIKDRRMAKLTIFLIAISFIFLALAPQVWLILIGLIIYAVGSGFNTFTRSLVSSLVDPAMIGTLYSTLSVADTTGSLLAGPLVATTYKLGMQLGGIFHGMPYMLSFGLCAIAALVMSRLKLNDGTPKDDNRAVPTGNLAVRTSATDIESLSDALS
ncbi:putative MFS transporter [Westerdykella ornata]|uniref:Putative MFS transporter n=1 Tax=Westerdykella ornata TaxID=318751 RepID=A0A6A6JNT3_WESOR|nr:putative MFS transporter [Westerdykella ornata]KAF2277336.1 putative MFS transporter [Westerdykella ornata]